ncbi:uncharacterized protein C8A04DRAFT_15080 [Dichotomopilus funicola]|uniref:NAD(P)-binding domain-containing protein n=1 Tax=Dichotomopilus funicola TaxID=1934379 RepID=A0AAN6UWW9_9PEZI|nr:hypothetical protein C8A04DRAFT_15080 [Dichotomopilus funicola]
MTPALLILGGTGTVGTRIVAQLSSSSSHPHHILVASRRGQPNTSNPTHPQPDPAAVAGPNPRVHHVVFDWHNPETWSNPFETQIQGGDDLQVTAVYLIAPAPQAGSHETGSGARVMEEFVDFARGQGVRRFVLQSGSPIEKGGPAMGAVHAYLAELEGEGVEWAVLRPTWFQENFADQEMHLRGVRDESKVYSATGDGKIPWVSADDIAAVAVRTLTDEVPHNTDYLVLGSELLSYSEIAEILTSVLHRQIVHVDLSAADLGARFVSFGMAEDYAHLMTALDTAVKHGSEERTDDSILAVTGSAPRRFREFAESVKGVWE